MFDFLFLNLLLLFFMIIFFFIYEYMFNFCMGFDISLNKFNIKLKRINIYKVKISESK